MKPTSAQLELLRRLIAMEYGELFTTSYRTYLMAQRCEKNGWLKATFISGGYYLQVTEEGRTTHTKYAKE